MAGEFDFIAWVRAQQPASEFVPLPAGDDLAVVRWPAGDLLLVGVDQVLDGVHFDSAVHPPRLIGRKVMNRNLSDCAAMACLPAAAVAAVALPPRFDPLPGGLANGIGLDYARELYLGLREAADPFGCAIVGGDTASWTGKLVFSVTILGRSAGVQPITRKGARPGDGIYVTGPLGGSIRGRHMTFSPRIELARTLARTGLVTAMIDLSDGLSRDLRHICQQSGVGAIITAAVVPIHTDALDLACEEGLKPVDQYFRALRHALDDGEDHELLFTAGGPPPHGTLVGRITAGPGLWIEQPHGERQPLEVGGWEHRL